MLTTTTRRRVVEEEVTEVVTFHKVFEAAIEHKQREQRERMKLEQNRLGSFYSGWSHRHQLGVSVAVPLAKAGFYCSGRYTECFSCGLLKPSFFWWEGHDPETVHREESPNCKFITGQSDNVPIDVKQQNKIKFISQPSLPSVSQPDTPQEKKVHELKPLKEKTLNQIKIETVPNKEQIEQERKTNNKYTITNQNRPTEQRTGSGREAEESGSNRQLPERRNDIISTSSLPDVPSISNGNHAVQNVHQRSLDVTWSSSSDVKVEKLTSRRDTRASTSTTYQKLLKGSTSGSIKETVESATTSRPSDVKRNKSATISRSLQELIMLEPSKDVAQAWNIENAAITSPDDSDAAGVKEGTTRQECFTSEIPWFSVSSDIFKNPVHFLVVHYKFERRKWLNKGTS